MAAKTKGAVEYVRAGYVSAAVAADLHLFIYTTTGPRGGKQENFVNAHPPF
jgi:hypothetical protein